MQGKWAAPTAPTSIHWGFCGNVSLGRKKNPVAIATQYLPYQAESHMGEQSQRCQGSENIGGFLGPGLGATDNLPLQGKEVESL